MATQKGNYVLWGNATGLTGATVGAITGYSRGTTLAHNSDLKEIKDGVGNVATIVDCNENYDLTVDVVPYSASSESAAAGLLKLPAKLEVVTVTGPTGDGAPTIAGKYYYLGGDKKLGGEEAEMTWRLRRYIANTLPAQS